MRAKKTVCVVGAGASEEVGLPFGRRFLEIVSEKLDFKWKGRSLDLDSGDSDILDIIQQDAPDRPTLEKYLDAACRIREGVLFSRSIDEFIDNHRDDQRIQKLGKLAIAKTILEQEQRCHMFTTPPDGGFQDVPNLSNSWFVKLARGLNEGIRLKQIDRIFEKVSFVVFNYDRCVEHFLCKALQKHYGVNATDAQAVMKTLTVLHPYGKIAKLPWEGDDGVEFGLTANRLNMLMMAGQIKTYTEQMENSETLAAIKSEIASAETLVFLGFSYLDLNMDVLDPEKECVVCNVFGTAVEMSASNIEDIKEQIRRLVRRTLAESRVQGGAEIVRERLEIRSDLKCSGLLEEYSRNLFAAGQRGGS